MQTAIRWKAESRDASLNRDAFLYALCSIHRLYRCSLSSPWLPCPAVEPAAVMTEKTETAQGFPIASIHDPPDIIHDVGYEQIPLLRIGRERMPPVEPRSSVWGATKNSRWNLPCLVNTWILSALRSAT